MIEIRYIEILYFLIFLIPLYMIFSKKEDSLKTLFSQRVLEKVVVLKATFSNKTRVLLLLSSIAFAIIALSRPYIPQKPIKVKSNFTNLVVGFDISNSMFAQDIYPNRFEFAKQKFYNLLENFKDANIAIVGFSSKAFLIAPMTHDYHSLKFLTSNLSFDYISLKGTSFLSLLQSTNSLYKNKDEKKALLIFTDGGDKDDLSKEIAYAKEHNIAVYIYAIATKKGAVIKTQNGVIKDKKGDIVITKLNENIKKLALETNGAYLKYSLKKDDIKLLSEAIKDKFKDNNKKQTIINTDEEIFYIPLMMSVLLFFMSLFSLPKGIKR